MGILFKPIKIPQWIKCLFGFHLCIAPHIFNTTTCYRCGRYFNHYHIVSPIVKFRTKS